MRVLMVAGEASGDAHAAKVARRLIAKGASVTAVGGAALEDAGARLLLHLDELAVLGFVEVVQRLPQILAHKRRIEACLQRESFDVFVPVDYPGLNLRLAKTAHACGVPVLYYIGPQVWAWRAQRLRHMRRFVDHVALILPFEKKLYDEAGVAATFVGHPLLDDPVLTTATSTAKASQREASTPAYDLGLFPGSRRQEVMRHLPVLLQAVQALRARRGDVRVIVSRAPTAPVDWMRRTLREHGLDPERELSAAPPRRLMPRCRALLVASGTATLEAALSQQPFAVVYKTGRINYAVARRLVRLPNVALVNLVAGETIVRELLQDDFAVAPLVDEATRLLDDDDGREKIRAGLAAVRGKLGAPGASERVASLVERLVEERAARTGTP